MGGIWYAGYSTPSLPPVVPCLEDRPPCYVMNFTGCEWHLHLVRVVQKRNASWVGSEVDGL